MVYRKLEPFNKLIHKFTSEIFENFQNDENNKRGDPSYFLKFLFFEILHNLFLTIDL